MGGVTPTMLERISSVKDFFDKAEDELVLMILRNGLVGSCQRATDMADEALLAPQVRQYLCCPKQAVGELVELSMAEALFVDQ